MKTQQTRSKLAVSSVHKPRLCTAVSSQPIQDLERREIRTILSRPAFQRKLNIGPVGDKHEREADRIANRVMRKPEESGEEKEESEEWKPA